MPRIMRKSCPGIKDSRHINDGVDTTVRVGGEAMHANLGIEFDSLKNGGESGIRTHDKVAPIPVFETGAFVRSAISPKRYFISKFEDLSPRCKPYWGNRGGTECHHALLNRVIIPATF